MKKLLPLLVLVLSACSLLFSLTTGSMGMGAAELVKMYLPGLHSGQTSDAGRAEPVSDRQLAMKKAVFEKIRLPRALASFLGGAILALAGAVFQCLLRNPLADPYVLGISAGGAAGAVGAMALGLASAWAVAGASFAGALATMLLVLIISRKSFSSATMLLSGVMINATLSSLISLLVYFAPRVKSVLFWLMGSFSGCTWTGVWLMGGGAFLLTSTVIICAPWMDCLAFGQSAAQSLGVPVRRLKFLLFAMSSAATALVVSFCGVIGFAGMVIPHFARSVAGSAHRSMLPVCLLAGGGFMCMADTISRVALSPEELPIGVVTGIVGGPLFIYLLTRESGGMR